jgi:hypothetical protein
MRACSFCLLFPVLTLSACNRPASGSADSQPLTPEDARNVDQGVRVFMQTVAHDVTQDGLTWGSDLRVDPLMPSLAVVAASWHEVRITTSGRLESSGFFTGTVELHDGHWQFRNAHWSEPVPAVAPAPTRAAH